MVSSLLGGAPRVGAQPKPVVAGSRMMSVEDLKTFKGSDEGRRLLGMAKQWLAAAERIRGPIEQQWYKNIDMTQGRQYTIWNPSERKMANTLIADPNSPRLSVNIIEGRVFTRLAKIGASRPSATVAPASNDDEDIMAARAAEACWEWYQSSTQFQHTVFNPANYWATVCGNGYIKTFFDETRPDPALDDARRYQENHPEGPVEPSAPQAGSTKPSFMDAYSPGSEPDQILPGNETSGGRRFDDTMFQPQGQASNKGVIRSIPVSPFHIFVPDLLEPNLQEQPYIFHVYMMPLEAARLAWKDYVAPDWSPQEGDENEIVQLHHLGITTGADKENKQIRVIELYVKPGTTKLLPKGGFVMIAGENEIVAVAKEGIPYEHGDYPFAMLTSIENGKFYRKAIVESMISIQNEVNRIYSQIIKHKNWAMAPQFFFEEGSLDVRKVTTRPGEFIPILMGSKMPVPREMPGIPAYTMDFLRELRMQLDDITGQHDVSRAVAPGADSAASMVSLLQEKDDDFLFSAYDSVRAALETTARHVLSYIVQFWDEPRMLKVIGMDAAFETMMLAGSKIKNNTDIRFDGESGLPKSRAARVALVTEWIDKQYIPKETGLKILEMGNLGKYFETLKLDENYATRQNIEFRRMTDADVQKHHDEWAQSAQTAAAELQEQVAGVAEPVDEFGQEQEPPVDMAAEMSGEPAPAEFGGAPAAPPAPAAAPGDESGLIAQTPVPTAGEIEQLRPNIVKVNEWDNHAVCMTVREQLLKSEAYKRLPPLVQEEVAANWKAHRDMLNQQMQEQAVLQGPPQTGEMAA